MVVRPHILIMVVSVIVVVSASAADLETETLLSGLENSEVSIFATTSDYVYHMETDKYKPGYVMYADQHALKTSDGNITETIAGHSTVSGYKEGVGEDARFNLITGFTQISPTRVIMLDFTNHCLRHVDRVSRATSVFAGQCKSGGYQDGASAKFSRPTAVIVDKKNSKQLLVADQWNNAVRTVEIESKNVGTFIKINQLIYMVDLVQDKITGDIYITNLAKKSLYKLSYNTKSLNMISYGSSGQINGKQPDYSLHGLHGVFMIETVILVADSNNDRILKYDTAYDTWSTLNACDETKTHKNTNQCVTKSPSCILLTSNRLLIGGDSEITSYQPNGYQSTEVSTTPDATPTTTFNPTTSSAGLTPTALPLIISTAPTTSVCDSQNTTLYTDPSTGTAKFELSRGHYINLSEGTHTYEKSVSYNQTCITTVNVIANRTDQHFWLTESIRTPDETVTLTVNPAASATGFTPTEPPVIISTSTTAPVCDSQNITLYTDPSTGSAKFELSNGHSIDLTEGTHTYDMSASYNRTCVTTVNVIANQTDPPPDPLTCPDSLIAITSSSNGLATFRLQFGDQDHVLMLPLGRYPYTITSPEQDCNVTLIAEDNRVRHRLELVADYKVDCSLLKPTLTWSLIRDVAQQRYTIIDALCGPACKRPADNSKPVLSCERKDELRIRWLTDRVFPADVDSVPPNIREALESRIRSRGVALDVVVIGASPPVVYPEKAANGGYISIALSKSCVDGFIYSNYEQKCVSK